MNSQLILYSRADCCLCEEMKEAIRRVAAKLPLHLEEIDVDSAAQLKDQFGDEVPVLFIDGRKAFKYKVTAKELEKRVRRRTLWTRLGLG
ncbi:MAG: glutaredoxin family protein [Candidatus Binatia bacterium]